MIKESDILHEVNGFWVSNEGTNASPIYHVWIPHFTHSLSDSSYVDYSIAVERCNYLAKTFGLKDRLHLPYKFA